MAGSKSNFLEDKALDHVLGGGDYTRPVDVFVALYTTAPTDAGGGTEVSGGGYSRAEVANDVTHWPPASNGAKANGAEIVFPEATASWGTVVAMGVFDAAVGGNLLYWADLQASKAIEAGDTARFPAGSITITED